MKGAYLLIVRNGAQDWPSIVENCATMSGLPARFESSTIAVFADAQCRCVQVDENGCVVGTLFHRHGLAEPVDGLTAGDSAAIRESAGDILLARFWGGYVSAIETAGRVRVIRDPSATFPCYFAAAAGYVAFASDAKVLLAIGCFDVQIDWRSLAQHFYRAGLPNPSTSLRHVRELLPGFSIDVGEALGSQVPRWSPWNLPERLSGGSEMTAGQLARTVTHCVRCWARGRGRLLVSVSGGLDSSIVVAALAEAGADLVCLTMFDEDPTGDERSYARALCGHFGLALIERPYRLEDVDICEPLATHLPRPEDRTHALAFEHGHVEVARDVGADAFVTGNGGDSILGYSQSAAPLADLWLSGGTWGELSASLLDICRQTGCSLIDAIAQAWKLARRPPHYVCKPNPLFLHRQALAELATVELDHPWLHAPPAALPGKAAHVAALLRVQQAFDPDRSQYLPVMTPLASQPIVEACIAVPSWRWRAGGVDRSLAREAFASRLPRLITRRRVKGSPGAFAARLLEARRRDIRERLMDGRLAREAIIDRDALEHALADGRCRDGAERVRILEFLAAEAWLDAWSRH